MKKNKKKQKSVVTFKIAKYNKLHTDNHGTKMSGLNSFFNVCGIPIIQTLIIVIN